MEAVPDVLPILQKLDLLIMPSLWEACPVLPMEAMCAGVPVLGSDCIGLREVLRGTPSLTSPAGDAPALASAIQEAIKPGSRHQAQAYVAEACICSTIAQLLGGYGTCQKQPLGQPPGTDETAQCKA